MVYAGLFIPDRILCPPGHPSIAQGGHAFPKSIAGAHDHMVRIRQRKQVIEIALIEMGIDVDTAVRIPNAWTKEKFRKHGKRLRGARSLHNCRNSLQNRPIFDDRSRG
jgi:hypothetical protein